MVGLWRACGGPVADLWWACGKPVVGLWRACGGSLARYIALLSQMSMKELRISDRKDHFSAVRSFITTSVFAFQWWTQQALGGFHHVYFTIQTMHTIVTTRPAAKMWSEAALSNAPYFLSHNTELRQYLYTLRDTTVKHPARYSFQHSRFWKCFIIVIRATTVIYLVS